MPSGPLAVLPSLRVAAHGGAPLLRIIIVTLAVVASLPPAIAQNRSVCGGRLLRETLAAIDQRGDLALGSGQVAAFSDLRLPHGDLRQAALARLREQLGSELAFLVHHEEDRWGRLRVAAIAEKGAAPVDLGRNLLAGGLAFVDPGEPGVLCRPELLEVEAEARRRGLGLWDLDGYKPVQAEDEGELRRRTGHFVLVEGRIQSVGERRSRTYLNFGRSWERDFTVTIPKKTWTSMVGRGWTADILRGRRVRVRGVLEAWRGPAIEVTSPDAVEVVDRGRSGGTQGITGPDSAGTLSRER